MNVHAKRWLPALAAGLLLLSASPSLALVNIELRPASQTVTNGTTVGIEIHVVSDDTTNQAVGLIQVAFVWDHTKLRLTGRLNNGPYLDWFPTGLDFFGDGEAAYFAVSLPPPNTAFATPAGLLVTTLQFTAIDTVTSTAISIVAQVGTRATEVRDAPTGGVVVTGTFASTVTVTIECSLDAHCDDGNDCTVDSCDVPTATCGHTFEAEFTACGDPTATTCNLADSCDAAGTCLANFRSESFPCGSATNTDCDNPDTCDGAGTCLTNLEPNGFACGDQSDTVCDDANTCDGTGTCLDNFEPDTTTCGDPGDTECDNPDMCDGAGACSTNLEPPGTACGDGTDNFCTDPDTCNGSGTCLANDFDCPGQICIEGELGPECVDCIPGDDSCNDFNACTVDVCLFGNFCVFDGGAMNGTPCPDADFCNGAETCQDGACVSPGTACDDENLCTDDFCDEQFNDCTFIPNDNNDPDDGLFCNGTDTCQGGQVVIGTPPTCDDQNACTLDSCDTELDACIHPNDPQGCDDGDACTFDDVCVGGQCQGEGPSGGNGAVDLVWDPLTTTVRVGEAILVGLRAVSADAINDGVFSMRAVIEWDPTVVRLVGVVSNDVMTCGGVTFGAPCTLSAPDCRRCGGVANGTPCTGGTGAADCVGDPGGPDCEAHPDGGNCLTQWSSEWLPCQSPLNECTCGGVLDGTPCMQAVPDCVDNPPEQTSCLLIWENDGAAEWNALSQLGSPANVRVPPSPGLLVTSFEFASVGLGSGSNVCVVPCIDGQTSRVSGGGAGQLMGDLGCATVNVVECLSPADCDDGLACTGVESCQSNACVTPPDPCDDSQICTDDSCVEGGGIPNCTNTPNDLNDPDDGLFCNGVDTCQAGVIVTGNPPNCDDLDVCTDDSCNEAIRDCQHVNNAATCDDGFPCTNSDVCAAGICAGTTIPDCVPCDIIPCNDGIGCTTDTCQATDICTFTSTDALCVDDGVFCNGVEFCDPNIGDPVTGCLSSGEPCPGCVEEVGCGCDAPVVAAAGSRYLAVTPLPAGGFQPVGIILSACGGTATKYVGAIGTETTAIPFDIDPSPCCLGIDGTLATLVTNPLDALFLVPGSTDGTAGGTIGWGGTVYIMAADIPPGTDYEVRLDCGVPPADPVLSEAVFATTWVYGDTRDDGVPDFLDILDQVFGFKDLWVEKGVVMPALDIEPCLPDQDADFLDMLWAVQAFKERPYSDNGCLDPCAP